MRNFGTLYGYELKKLLKRKTLWLAVIAVTVLIVYAAWQPKDNKRGADFLLKTRDGEEISGFVSLAQQAATPLESMRKVDGQVMDETFFQNLRDILHGSGEYIIRDRGAMLAYFYLVDNTWYAPFSQFTEGSLWEFDTAAMEQQLSMEGYYGDREETLESVWAKLPEGQADFWRKKESQVQKPFVYRNAQGWRRFQEHTYFLYMLLPVLAAVCLCGVFSEERRLRTDMLILSSKRGRFPLYLAKALAGMTALSASVLLVAAADAVVVTCQYGWDGFDAALQLWITFTSLPYTMGGATLRLYGLLLLYILIFGGFTMLISSAAQNTIAALIVPVLGMVMVENIPTNAWMGNTWIGRFWPRQFYSIGPAFTETELVPFFGGYLTNLQIGYILYGALALLLTALCWIGWRRCAEG